MGISQIFENKRLIEARQPTVEYVEKEAKGQVERVTALLRKNQSIAWNRLTEQYVELDTELKNLAERRDSLNSDLKLKATDLFALEDEVLTRVIETSKLTITLSKKSMKPSVPKVDSDAVIKDLLAAEIVPELKNLVKKLIKAHTTMTKETEVPEKMTVKVNEGVISGAIDMLISAVRKMFTKLDSKIERLKIRVQAL